jgi:hypothetical protein
MCRCMALWKCSDIFKQFICSWTLSLPQHVLTRRYILCVINSSQTSRLTFSKLYTVVMNALEMSMQLFGNVWLLFYVPLTTCNGMRKTYFNLDPHGSPFSCLLRFRRGCWGSSLTRILTGWKCLDICFFKDVRVIELIHLSSMFRVDMVPTLCNQLLSHPIGRHSPNFAHLLRTH